MKKSVASQALHGVGRRKAAVARVWLKPGKGTIEVNGKQFAEYFNTDAARSAVVLPLQVCGAETQFDVMVYVTGGGETGQSGAVKLGIARGLLKSNEALRGVLRQNDLLTVDARYLSTTNYQEPEEYDQVFTPAPVNLEIAKDTTVYRVFDITNGVNTAFNGNAITSVYHQSIGGYHAAKLSIYQDLIEKQLYKFPDCRPVVNMLNTKKSITFVPSFYLMVKYKFLTLLSLVV